MRVLDLACGAGSQTIQVARRLGPDGKVVGSDISTAMLVRGTKRTLRDPT
jgi:ubiquinone/menaquinone biosynthesis C-methylase UbiE